MTDDPTDPPNDAETTPAIEAWRQEDARACYDLAIDVLRRRLLEKQASEAHGESRPRARE